MKAFRIQPDDAAMADEVPRFEIVVIARLLHNDRGALQVNISHASRQFAIAKSRPPSLGDVKVRNSSDATKFVSSDEVSNAVLDGTLWKQSKACDSSGEVSSWEPTPAAWAYSYIVLMKTYRGPRCIYS